MRRRIEQNIWNSSARSWLAVAAILAAPASAAAQYTLTFDASTQFAGTAVCSGGVIAGCTVGETYGSVANVVAVDNGTLTDFGKTGNLKTDFLDNSGSVVGEDGDVGFIDSKGNIGAFDFTTLSTSKPFFTLDSLRVGLSSAATCVNKGKTCVNSGAEDAEVEIYSDANVLLWDSGVFAITPGTSTLITPPAAFAANVNGGLKLEFGPVAGLSTPDGNYFSVDNITYDVAAYTPEPGALVLLGTGLVVLLPVTSRRRS